MTAPAAGENRLDTRTLVTALLVTALIFAGLYGMVPYTFGYDLHPVTVLQSLYVQVIKNPGEDWSHCVLVPFISLFLLWYDRKKILAAPVRGNTVLGGLLLVVAGLFYWIGFKIDIAVSGYFSMQLTLAALIVWFFGVQFMRAVFFPWIFLVFAWPMPFIQTGGLRLLMTTASAQLLNILQMPTIQQGTALISAPDHLLGLRAGERFMLDIAAACSGIRSLFSLMMTGALAGYLMLDKVWQRWLVFFCSVPFALVGNTFRIVMLAFGAHLWGQKFAVGTGDNPSVYHQAAGFMVFFVALTGIFCLCKLLDGGWRKILNFAGVGRRR